MKPIIAIVLAAALLAGCSKGYSNDDFRADLRESGLPDDKVACVEQGFHDAGISPETYMENEDNRQVVEIVTNCLIPEEMRNLVTTTLG